ncbi:hypothetical protein EJ04DRAFT_526149 [Polyplosphaeria fusca]|uniref:Protein transport protein sec16 n=1 Tax=Polyplosphaeria fusca TaxID=682080 RepID=A0A9P4QPR2_9PLEO|nr:hypothetical protein EJ04DRAFT_526149 [Polyplosphaeria fusca]
MSVMDNEDGPNFGYAYGGTASTSTWNPALRPDHDEPSSPSNAAKPSTAVHDTPAPKKRATRRVRFETDEKEEEEVPSDDDFFDRYGPPIASNVVPPQSAAQTNGDSSIDDPETPPLITPMGTEMVEPILDTGRQDVNGTQEDAHDELPGEEESTTEAPEEHTSANYEHQGEATQLDDALVDSSEAPLIDEAGTTTDDWGSSGEGFDLEGAPQEAPLPTPPADAVGTNVGDQIIGGTKVGGNTGDDIDWGNGVDEQDFFGTQAQDHSLAAETQPAATNDSAWDIALDDDFLPDVDENAAPQFHLDDDEGFLDDSAIQEVTQPTAPTSSASRYAPQVAQVPQPAASPYSLQGPQFTDLSQQDRKQPVAAPSPAYGGYGQPSSYAQQPSRPPMQSSAQSFADKAKGGYASPYDLPEDIVTTRKKPAHRPSMNSLVQPTPPPPPPPPRTSSMSSTGAARPPPPSNMSASSLSPPSSSHSMQAPTTGFSQNAPPKPAPSKTASSDFFAELPTTQKPKPSGRYTPQSSVPNTPGAAPPHYAHPHLPPKERTSSWSALRNEILPDQDNLMSQLQQPDRLPAFPEQPMAPPRRDSLPVPSAAPAPPAPSRYSPAPASAPLTNQRYSPAPPTAPAANARYSPAPQATQAPVSGPPRPQVQSYAPRTSSPLAFHTMPQEHGEDSTARPASMEGAREMEEHQHAAAHLSGPPTANRSETPPLLSPPSSTVGSPRKRSNYTPQYQPGGPANGLATRSQSHSPDATMKKPLYNMASVDRPASTGFGVQTRTPEAVSNIPHKRQMSVEFQYIAPTDERSADPLERWKGYPIFKWGLGGTVITAFPKQIPRYGGGASMPMMKCAPGEVKTQSAKDVLPLQEDITKFPGPLKSKGKKKEVSSWLGRKIESLESDLHSPGFESSVSPEDFKRLEEKVLLWKIMQALVDNDGRLEGNASAEAAVRSILSPEGADAGKDEGNFATGADLVGISRSSTVQSEPVDPRAVEELRSLLTKGDREKAVWHAVDQRLWAHAMLLSSTLSKDIWKQVVREFVQKEVKKAGRNNQALAVLYEIFSGNWDDCIDELVPAAARAGFQMMNTDGAGSSDDAAQGLNKWRETLSLVLNNRSEGDAAALLSLGRLLAGYGRVEAAHICFIFARSGAHVGGLDDPQSDLVLVGADHRSRPNDLGNNLESVLLTEVYEFAMSLAAPGGSQVLPHLQSYKLVHAFALAEYGQRSDAQAYCDAIAYAMKSTTKVSPYYNGNFIATLDDLSKRLSQSPKDGSSSWILKPNMDKVSSSILSKFSSFIAGDEDEVASNHSGGNDVGPFAKIAGSTPNLSPSQSSADLYGAYSGYGAPAAPVAQANSRYAPSNAYAPRTSSELGRSRYEPQGRPSLESQPSDAYMPSPSTSGPYTPSQTQSHFSPPGQRMQASNSQPYAQLKEESAAVPMSYGTPYQPTPPAEELAPSFGGYQPPQAGFDVQPPSPPTDFAPVANSYEPPTSGYEPPSYQPYQPDEFRPSIDANESTPLIKKKSFMDLDEDDDIGAQSAALKKQQKSEADRKADEAFRKAAEADAQRDKDTAAAKKAGGWFSGFWGKKDPNAPPGPIKAKLGEENSFYYDPELKKWVNKKGGAAEATKPISTPPPPRSGPPSRAVSGNSVSANHALGAQLGTSLPPSALSTMSPPTSAPQRSSSMPPPMAGPHSRASTPGVPSDGEGKAPPLTKPVLSGSGPPSRPGTGMSNASSIDDLLGAPAARKGGGKKGKRGGRFHGVPAVHVSENLGPTYPPLGPLASPLITLLLRLHVHVLVLISISISIFLHVLIHLPLPIHVLILVSISITISISLFHSTSIFHPILFLWLFLLLHLPPNLLQKRLQHPHPAGQFSIDLRTRHPSALLDPFTPCASHSADLLVQGVEHGVWVWERPDRFEGWGDELEDVFALGGGAGGGGGGG